MESEKQSSAVSDIGAWAMNVVSSVCIIMANKQLMSSGGYAFGFGSLQGKYSIESFELLIKITPIQAVFLILMGPSVDYMLNGKSVLDYKMTSGALMFILPSCLLAVFCNISQSLCIGRFSAVSFQVLGHMKIVCVLILGWVLFDSALTLKNIMGMFISFLGTVVYCRAVEVEKQANPKALSTKSSHTEVEIRLLKDGAEKSPAEGCRIG